MADDVLVMEARLKNLISAETKKIAADVQKMEKNMKGSFTAMNKGSGIATKHFSLMKLAIAGVAIAAGTKLVGAFVKAGTQMETLSTQFRVLLGSTEAAQVRMEELSDFAAKTPFKLDQVANASRILETLTKGALATGDGLRTVGDAAAATGADFQNLAMHVGRAYDGLQSNRPVGESMMRLQELGIVSGETRAQIEMLQKAGKGKEAWNVLQAQLDKTKGGMEALSKTVPGLTSTLRDQLDAAMRDMMDSGVWDAFRDSLQLTVNAMQKALDSGVFTKMGQSIASVIDGFQRLMGKEDPLQKQKDSIKQTNDLVVILSGRLSTLRKKSKAYEEALEKTAADDPYRKILLAMNAEAEARIERITARIQELGQKSKETLGEIDLGGGGSEDTATPSPQKSPITAVIEDPSVILEAQQRIFDALQEQAALDGQNKLQLLEAQHAREIEMFKGKEEELSLIKRAHEIERGNVMREVAEESTEIAQAEKDQKLSNFNAIANASKTMIKVMGKESKAAAVAGKAIAITQAIINTAVAATKANTATPYPPVNAGLMAVAIAQGMAQVAVIASQKFAEGGIVGGTSFTGDNVPARVNSGEMILNQAQQAELFRIAQGEPSRISPEPRQNFNVSFNVQGNLDNAAADRIMDRLDVLQSFADNYEEAKRLGIITEEVA